ncbi:carbon-nitrogen hydrolase family protein [Streptomyces sp. NPDC056987]|uniref:carbon-nitrogen hydrolase family protein n=1 Tax=Streptomyces sp. NPDC056987 TaxID=3345988 RepID=UPI00363FE4E6
MSTPPPPVPPPAPALAPALPAAPLRVAVAQTEAVSGDVAANARRAAALTVRAADRGARVVVLPELHLCGYDLPALAAAPDRYAVRADPGRTVADPRLDPLAEAAAAHSVTVLTGAAVRGADGALTNSVVACGPSGAPAVAYDKQHLWHADERALFSAGDRGASLTVDGWRLGLGVCYDMSFPEHGRAAALAGAHAYLCPSAFAAGNEYRAAVYLAARALENTVYAVFGNPVGGPPHRPCGGGTAVHGPGGREVARAATAGEETVLADLDPAELAGVRGLLHMLEECRASASGGAASRASTSRGADAPSDG